MKLALLGDDYTVWRLLSELRRAGRHSLTVAALPNRLKGLMSTNWPEVRQTEQWDILLVDSAVDAVLVCGSSEATTEAARRLASEGKPLIYVPHGSQTSLAYELSLARDDGRCSIAPFLPLRFLKSCQELRSRIQRGELGRIAQILWERREVSDPSRPVPLLQPGDLEQNVVGDLDLLRWLGGNYDRVTALQSGVIDGLAATVSVSLAGDGLPDAVSNLVAVSSPPTVAHPPSLTGDWSLTVIGTEGRASIGSLDEGSILDPSDLLDSLERSSTASESTPVWNDLLRACESADAARRSLKRRRTIDLHFESTSERSQFKTQMTAVGCGVLFLTLVLVLLLVLVGSLVEVPPAIMRIARVAVFAPLFVFILLQGLIVLARPAADRRKTRE